MLELQNICWSTPEGKEVLNNVNMKIEQDKLIAITGPNGSGKTTLARILMGIEKPTSGRIILDGEDITELSVTERAKKGISFAFQQPVRFKGITVKQLLETACQNQLSAPQICGLLQKVGLFAKDYINRDIDATLSGGEIKRIEIASVLARHTEISIFDEPEAGIDLWSFQNLIQTFDEMRQSLKGTLVIISHQERILKIADEIVLISGGTVVDQGPGAEMLEKMLAHEKETEKTVHCCERGELGND